MSLSVIWKFLSAFALTTEDTEDTEKGDENNGDEFPLLQQMEAFRLFSPLLCPLCPLW